jgi:hypothetical protein
LEKRTRAEAWREAFARAFSANAFFTIPFGVVAGALILASTSTWYERLFGVGLFVAIAYILFRPKSFWGPSGELRRLADHFSGVYHSVHVIVFKDDKPIGRDEGIVTFELGMLLYRGVRTDFALGRGDVFLPEEASTTRDARFGDPESGLAWGFRLADDPSVRLFFTPNHIDQSTSIQRPLHAWLTSDLAVGGNRLLPPNVPMLGRSARALTR